MQVTPSAWAHLTTNSGSRMTAPFTLIWPFSMRRFHLDMNRMVMMCVMNKSTKLRPGRCAVRTSSQAVTARRTLCTKPSPGAFRRRSPAMCFPCHDALSHGPEMSTC